MENLAVKFLEGKKLDWHEIRRLYSHYKTYVSLLGKKVSTIDISPFGDAIMWEYVFNTGSIILQNEGKSDLNDEQLFSFAILIREMEYLFYKLRLQERSLSDVLFLSVMDRQKGEDVAEQIGVLDVGDDPEKRYYWSQTGIPHMVEKSCRRIAKMRNRTIEMLTFLDKPAERC